MKVSIEVKDKREGELIKRAMEDVTARASAMVIGILLGLDSHRARARVMNYVIDYFEEEDERASDKEARALHEALNSDGD